MSSITDNFLQLTATFLFMTWMMMFVVMMVMVMVMVMMARWGRTTTTITTTGDLGELLPGQLLQYDVLCRKFFFFKDRKHVIFPFKRN